MAGWIATVNVKSDWHLAKINEISIHELAQRVIPKLKALPMFKDDDPELTEIVDWLEDLTTDETASATDFDEAWGELYNWADRSRVWIATNF